MVVGIIFTASMLDCWNLMHFNFLDHCPDCFLSSVVDIEASFGSAAEVLATDKENRLIVFKTKSYLSWFESSVIASRLCPGYPSNTIASLILLRGRKAEIRPVIESSLSQVALDTKANTRSRLRNPLISLRTTHLLISLAAYCFAYNYADIYIENHSLNAFS
jgi:hypothetical protein